MDFLQRQETLLGKDCSDYIATKKIAIIGVGGVGGSACEAIARCGYSHILVLDNDDVDITNINRQIIATHETIGQRKTDVAKARVLSINPEATVTNLDVFYTKEINNLLLDFKPDFIIDAIDSVSSKLDLIEFAFNNNIKIVSSMGTGNKVDPFSFHLSSIAETSGSGCPLARVMRKELKKRGITTLDVVHSTAPVYSKNTISSGNGRNSPGSVSFVPPVSGFLMASFVTNTFINEFNIKEKK